MRDRKKIIKIVVYVAIAALVFTSLAPLLASFSY
jgi:hypothetical protein